MRNPYVEDMLMHYGMPRRSGRYPWGSGKEPYQHSGDFLARVEQLQQENFVYTDEKGKSYTGQVAIAKALGMNTTELRTQISLAQNERRAVRVATAEALRDKGYSPTEIGRRMGVNESTIRSYLNENSKARMNRVKATAEILKKQVDETGMLDVGAGVELELGVSRLTLDKALYTLKTEGYPVYKGGVPQVTNKGQQTNIQVLCPPGTENKDIYKYGEVHSVKDYTSHDGGLTFTAFKYPASMDSSRVDIRYGDKGGLERDGLIEIKRGVKDLDLGDSNYAQVRILVDGTHYMKGMAVYSDGPFPPGKDLIFNTNKTSGTPQEKVFKPIKTDDPRNPFGSLIKANGQSEYIDIDGKPKLSLINKRAEEGDWGEWADRLSSQFLSKQKIKLAKRQLDLAASDKEDEFMDILELDNPTVRRSMLETFANDCDSAAVHLYGAALPRQKYQVILPIPSMKETEIYAPNYIDGEQVALIRYPHGGIFEIPVLKVNNKQKEARVLIGANPIDAVGINAKTAAQLSGADFDGDTVMVIPLRGIDISAKPPLEGLKDFDPHTEYAETPGMKILSKENTQIEMGKISNLITDMTLKGATESELTRAVKHSMVVIDANKHKLDYKRSEIENGIESLKREYQGHYDEDGKYHTSASTLISRAKADYSVPKRQGSPRIDPETGALIFKENPDNTYVDKKGKVHNRTQKSTQMAETSDARTLISDANTPMENVYADYANRMKSLANQARLQILDTPNLVYSKEARQQYANEVESLGAKLRISSLNAPRERQAQLLANDRLRIIKETYPDITKKELKKRSQQELTQARLDVGAKRTPLDISDREWEAIQAGAVTDTTLRNILRYADTDAVRQLATPREKTTLSEYKVQKIQTLSDFGYTQSQIASVLGVSPATVNKYLTNKE